MVNVFAVTLLGLQARNRQLYFEISTALANQVLIIGYLKPTKGNLLLSKKLEEIGQRIKRRRQHRYQSWAKHFLNDTIQN